MKETNHISVTREELLELAKLAVAGRADALADALRDSPHPMEIVEAARHHGLASIFHKFTERRTDIPTEVASALKAIYGQNRARAIVLLGEAQRVMKILEDAGIPCMPLKGASLAEELYGDPALRPMTDVDILVPIDAVPTVRPLMEKAGYVEEEGDLREDFQEKFRSEISYFRSKPFPSRLEIHWGLLNFGGHEGWVPEVFARSVKTVKGRRMSLEDTLLYLAAHAAYHHQHDRLIWEFDIALLMQSRGMTFRPDTVASVAQHHRLLMPLRWAIETGERFGVEIPPQLIAAAEARKVGRVERWALRFAREPELASAVRALLTLRSIPGFRAKWSFLAAKAFPDRKHLEMRHQARGFWPWIYAKRLFRLGGILLIAPFRRHKRERSQ